MNDIKTWFALYDNDSTVVIKSVPIYIIKKSEKSKQVI